MKKLVCEMCGSTELIKQDGVFVCQTCGCKYSVEEARKMMVEGTVDVSGSTVKVDNSGLIDSYLQMAENALDASNNAEAEAYANKIIEIDQYSYRAWYIKGRAAGWQTTGANNRFPESVVDWINAYSFAPEDNKGDVSSKIKEDGSNIALAILTMKCNTFEKLRSEDYKNAVLNSITMIETQLKTLKAKTQIDIYTSDFMTMCAQTLNSGAVTAYNASDVAFGSDVRTHSKFQWEQYAASLDCCCNLLDKAYDLSSDDNLCAIICENFITIAKASRDSFSCKFEAGYGVSGYVKDFSFTDAAKKIRTDEISKWEAKLDKHDSEKRKLKLDKVISYVNDARDSEEKELAKVQYWETHSEEKARLTQELTQLSSDINQINALVEADTDRIEMDRLENEIANLNVQMKSLGMFKGKEKKELTTKIEKITQDKKSYKDKWVSKKEIYDKELNSANNRKSEIVAELNKDRGAAKIQPRHCLIIYNEGRSVVNGLDLVEYHKLVIPKEFSVKGDGEDAIENYAKTIYLQSKELNIPIPKAIVNAALDSEQEKQYRVSFMYENSVTHIVLDFFGKEVTGPIGKQLKYTLVDDKTPLAVSQYVRVVSSAILGICPDIDMNEFIKTLEEAAYGYVIEKQFEVNDIICIVTGGCKNDLKCTLKYKK